MFDEIFNRAIFGRKPAIQKHILMVDVHAHLLPQLDDGPIDIEQSIEIIKEMYLMGYRKIILTPHIMSGYYNNTPEDIFQSLQILRSVLKRRNINMDLEAAAEYYLEEALFELIDKKEVLTFGGEKKYLLFEASFITQTKYLLESVIRIKEAGYTPVLAHPERYTCLNSMEAIGRLAFNGALFQLNIASLNGYYSKQVQEFAELLIMKKLVAFLGTDCHSLIQLESIKAAYRLQSFQEAVNQDLLNNSLLESRKPVFA